MVGTVHIVDDDASFRTAIERRLEKAGYRVETYETAQQLLDQWPDGNGPSGPGHADGDQVRALIMSASAEDWRGWVLHVADNEGNEVFDVPFVTMLGKPH